jgi:signal peptidase I
VKKKEQKQSLFKKIGSVFFYVISGLLIIYIITEAFMPTMTIKIFQFKPYVVITESMEPVLNVDDMIIVFNPKVDELEVDDIITFEADIDYNGTKEIVTHYIYSITDDGEGNLSFRTVRQGGTVPDTWILSEQDVIGVYGFKISQLGVFINFIKSPFGIAAILVNIGVIVAIVVLVKSDKKKTETKK